MRRILVLFTLLSLCACGGQSKEELAQEGQALLDSGNYRGAVVLFKNALEKDVNFLDARSGLAAAYLKSGNFDRAEKEYQKVLLQNPTDTQLLLKLADIHIQLRQSDQAILDLEKYHSKNEETVESLVLSGRAYGASGDLSSAENLFSKALTLDPQATDPRLNLARVYLQRKDFERARLYLTELLEIKPDDLEANYLLASVDSRLGKHQEALDVYRHITSFDSRQLQALYMAGILEMELGHQEEAVATAAQLKSTFPDNAEGFRVRGMLLYREGKYEEAKLELEASNKKSQHLLSYYFLGLSLYSLEQYEQALNQFQKVLDLNPDFNRARIAVAMTLLRQKRTDDAILEARKVLQRDPENAFAHNVLGSALLAAGKYDDAMSQLDLATQIDPAMVDAHLKKGLFHLQKGDGKSGEADLLKAVQAAPEILNSRLMLVTHYLRQKDYASAINTLQEGMSGERTDALLNNYLAAAYFSQKKNEEALTALQKAKEIDPDYLTPYFNIAAYYASVSAYDSAVAEYRSLLQHDNKNLKALLALAALYNVTDDKEALNGIYSEIETLGSVQSTIAAAQYQLRNKNSDRALEIVSSGLETHANEPELLQLKGFLLAGSGRTTEAEEVFIKLSGVDPRQGNSLLARLYSSSGQQAKARELVDALLKSDPNEDYPYLLAAGVYRSGGDLNASTDVLEQGIATVREPVRLRMQLGRLLDQQNQSVQAENIYRRIIQEAPRFAPAYSALGYLKERDGDKGKAQELYRSAVKYDADNVSALNNLAYLLVDNFGENQEALNFAMKAYRLQPSDPRIMDTLGYVLIKNDRADDAVNLLEKSHQLLPDVSAVSLHLAQAYIEVGDREKALLLLQQVKQEGTEKEIAEAVKLLK